MAATTYLGGADAGPPPPPPPLAAGARLSWREGWALVRTPSSEAGVQAYHRALEGEPAGPERLLAEIAALREGRTTRFELLTAVAVGERARRRGVGGPGLLVIRAARKLFTASGLAARVKSRRALAAQAEAAARSGAGAPVTPAEVTRKLVVLEGALIRLETRLYEDARTRDPAIPALEARIAALEAELRARLVEQS